MDQRAYPPVPEQVYLFGTCLIDMFVPEAGVDAVFLLQQAGLRVHYPQQQSCCGQPAYSSGNPQQAREVARAQLDLFAQPWPVVVPSGSCAGMMRHHWPALFADEPEWHAKALALAERVFELTEFYLHVLQQPLPQPQSSNSIPTEHLALHTSCAARREMGTRLHGVEVLNRLPGIALKEHVRESECCGFGGTFSLKHPDISGAMVQDKLAAIRATGCDGVVTADCGCMLNLRHTAEFQQQPIRIEHMASFLRRRLFGTTGKE